MIAQIIYGFLLLFAVASPLRAQGPLLAGDSCAATIHNREKTVELVQRASLIALLVGYPFIWPIDGPTMTGFVLAAVLSFLVISEGRVVVALLAPRISAANAKLTAGSVYLSLLLFLFLLAPFGLDFRLPLALTNIALGGQAFIYILTDRCREDLSSAGIELPTDPLERYAKLAELAEGAQS